MPTKHARSVWGQTRTAVKAWAVVNGKGRIVLNDNDKGMLVFDKKWRAGAQVWKPGERMVQIEIRYSSLANSEKP